MVHGNIIKRGMWKMAKVVDLIPGKDGVVQGAKVCGNVKGKHDVKGRPMQKL